MIASILWKEYREHRAVWVALAFVAFAALVGVPWAFPPDPGQQRFYQDGLIGIALALAWTYGIVCGSMLLAGEAENGTQGYLDLLPAARLPIWLAKVLAGGLFVLLQVIVLIVLGSYTELFPLPLTPAWGVALAFAGALGLGWGACCSARASSVLSSIGWAIFTQLLLLPLLQLLAAIPLVFVAFASGVAIPQPVAFALAGLLALLVPWTVSALRYCGKDQTRTPARPRRTRQRLVDLESWRASIWLARRQNRGFAWGLVLFCLAAGFPVAALGLVLWPFFSLVVGVLCGVTVFFDEQRGPYRFLGDQRLPLPRLWVVKAGVRFGVAVLGLGALLVPSVLNLLVELGQHPILPNQGESVLSRLFHAPLLGHTIPPALFLFTPMLYGFTVGHFSGIVFRKALVAVVVAFGLSLLLLSAWVPSFLAGGLHAWQVLAMPIVLVVGARLILHLWSANLLLSRASVLRLGVIVVAALLLTVAGLWYRVVEVPDVPEPAEFRAFVASLPKPEENEAGMAIRSGLAQLSQVEREWQQQHQLQQLPAGFWPVDQEKARPLGEWLDSAFAREWWKRLGEARGKPVGVVQDPRLLTATTSDRDLVPAQSAGSLLAARGLQMQAMGDPAVLVENLDIALTLTRNLEHAGTAFAVLVARQVEAHQVAAVQHWLEALPDRADLLRRASEALARHRDRMPATPWDVELVEYLIALNSIEQPPDWLRGAFRSYRPDIGIGEPELLAHARRVPWEQERQLRLVRASHWNREAIPEGMRRFPNFIGSSRFGRSENIRAGRIRQRANLEAAVLRVALRRYQAEKRHPAKSLVALVPEYLPAIPADPFDGQPFRYRLSEGERIVWVGGNAEAGGPNDEQWHDVPAGQGILWCVGEDGQDDGGKKRANDRQSQAGQDVIFLVPLPAKP